MMSFIIENNKISISLNKQIYSLDAIFKCIYWYGDKWNVIVDEGGNDSYFTLTFSPKSDEIILDEKKAKVFFDKIINDLNDFRLRDIITKETKNVRDLLVAKAFSNGEFDEDPPGEFEDFLGTQNFN